MTDPEPGRCRRTDGKKWRCSREVIPGQKYCGKHMHRGRRSRKPVEASEYVMRSDDTSITSKRSKLNASPDDLGSKCAPEGSKTSCLSSTSRNNQNNSVEDSSANPRIINSSNGSEKQDDHMTCNRKDTGSCLRTPSFIVGDNGDSKNIDFNRISLSQTNQKQNYGDARDDGALVPNFGISAKSDLQHTTETDEQQRCRRSDGKKWRCSRDVVPHQKYCEIHMHRGTKRKRVASDSVIVPPSKPSLYRFCPPENGGTGRNLNTSLSIYTIPPGPQNVTNDDSNSNSSSDATTVTDEIPAFVSR